MTDQEMVKGKIKSPWKTLISPHSGGTLERTGRAFGHCLAKVLRVLAERFPLRLHELALHPQEVREVLSSGQFLRVLRRSRDMLVGITFHFLTQISIIKPCGRGFYAFFEEIEIVIHCFARLFKTLRHHVADAFKR